MNPLNPLRPYVLGLDPGLRGGVSILSIARPRELIVLQDLPLTSDCRDIDAPAFAALLDIYNSAIRFCVIEKVSAMTYTNKKTGEKRGQGAAASFAFGKGFGLVLGCLHSAQIPVFEVAPSVWKILLGLSSNKSASISLAHNLYPASRSQIKLKKHDGRAESLLLAHFGAGQFAQEKK